MNAKRSFVVSVVLVSLLPSFARAADDAPLLAPALVPNQAALALQRDYLLEQRPGITSPIVLAIASGLLLGAGAVFTSNGVRDLSSESQFIREDGFTTAELAIGITSICLAVGGMIWAKVSAGRRLEKRTELDRQVFEIDAKLSHALNAEASR